MLTIQNNLRLALLSKTLMIENFHFFYPIILNDKGKGKRSVPNH